MRVILSILVLLLTFSVQADIKSIPQQDLKKIKYLFESLIDDHDFSYTIFGSKPMSLADFSLEAPSDLPFVQWIKSKFLMFKRKASLEAWYKYRQEFVFKDFIFLDEEKDLISCLALILINKKNMLLLLHAHEDIFKKELGNSFSPELFLEKLENRGTSFANVICKNQRLLGIMLGYGVRNSTIFQERSNLKEMIETRKKTNLPEDETLKQKYSNIESQVQCFSEPDPEASIQPLYFLADVNHPETISLKQQYEQERQHIIELRKKNNFMEIVLKRLVTADNCCQ